MVQIMSILPLRKITVFGAFLLFASLGLWGKIANPGWHTDQFYHEGALRQYRFYIPSIPGKEKAVVMLFHNAGENMNNVFGKYGSGTNRWLDLAESDGFMLVVPNGTDLKTGEGRGGSLHWNDCRPARMLKNRSSKNDDVSFIRKVMGKLRDEFEFDPSKVYAAGSGEGALMVFRLAFEAPDLVAAVAAINTSFPLNTHCKRSKQPIPVLLINGTKDDVFPWIGGQIDGRAGFVMSVPKMRNYLVGYNWVSRDQLEKINLSDKEPEDECRVERHFFPGSPRGADLCFLYD